MRIVLSVGSKTRVVNSMKEQMNNEKEKLVFVVHKHHATSLHYDFRLQVGDLMPSWAIPKGPTLDPKLKRLAMETTDHSMEYRHFEGVLPEGQYGAGPVMIWDEGTYVPEREIGKGERELVEDYEEGHEVMRQGLEKGEIKFRLYGKKLKGSFALVKTKGFGGPKAWLMIKHKDEFIEEGYDAHQHDYSARSGKTLEQIRKGE